MRREVYKTILPGGIPYTRIVTIIGPHGGKRQGAGRKAMQPEEKRQRLSTTVSPESALFIQDQANNSGRWGVHQGQIIDDLVSFYLKHNPDNNETIPQVN